MKKATLCFFILVISLFSTASAKDKSGKTICLNMIVKDEKDVIERCLGSLKHIIDYWVIFDTGSTDGTQEVIKNFMKDVPGELHESPWVNFAHNRNEALNAAKGKADYIMLIDADEILEYVEDFNLPVLDKDCYYITVRQLQAADCNRVLLINSKINWRWEGVLHEVLRTDDKFTPGFINGVRNICNSAVGARSKEPDQIKYMKDAMVLEKALKDEPENARYWFYLGVSYLAADAYHEAERAFKKRVTMEIDDLDNQETYQAYYNLGIALEKQDKFDEAIEVYTQAHTYRSRRAEPLFRIARLYRKQNKHLLGYLFSSYAVTFPYPTGDACIEYMAWDYEMLVEHANCALLLGKWEEGLKACSKLLNNPHVPADIKPQIISNYNLAMKETSRIAMQRQAQAAAAQ